MEPTVRPGGDDAESDARDIADDIRNAISAAIMDRQLEPGSKLPEDAIGDHFGVSRTVVRAAINRLQQEQLVEIKKNRGAFVARPTVEEARDVLDARRGIERAIVERVVDRASPEQLDELWAYTQTEDDVHASKSHQAAVRHSLDFHLRLARLAGNKALDGILELLVHRSELVMALYSTAHDGPCGAGEHRALLDAIRAKDKERACRIMEDHLIGIEQRLRLQTPEPEDRTIIDVLARYSRQS